MNLTELIMKRRSCRKFTEEAVSANDIKELKRVALCSPTSKNCRSCWRATEYVSRTEFLKASHYSNKR